MEAAVVAGHPLPDRPRLRSDLIVREQRWRGQPVAVIKDPDSRRYVRVSALGYAIARELRGEHTLDELLPRLRLEHRVALDQQQLEGFVRHLDELGFLTNSERARPPRRQPRWYERILQIEVPLTPQRPFLDRLRPLSPILLHPLSLITSLVLILLAYGFLATQHRVIADQIADQIGDLSWSRMFVAYYLASAVLTVVHELGHGIACTCCGGSVRRLGFVLYYFQPAFFCDTSDSWLLPEKRRRMGITLAGLYTELLVGVLGIAGWVATEQAGLVNVFFFLLMLLPIQSLLINLNPCLKYDGYWLLSDLLEVPNLRARAFRHLRQSLWAWLRRRPVPVAEPGLGRIYWLYGVPSLLYTGLTLVLFGWFLARFLIGRFGAGGIALLLLWVALLLLNPVLRVRHWLRVRGQARSEVTA